MRIDTDVRIRAGQCALAAPGVFTQDDDGFSTLLPGREDGVTRGSPRVSPCPAAGRRRSPPGGRASAPARRVSGSR
ncbi:ferredoxin [Streptomyces sp. YKOK-I1]